MLAGICCAELWRTCKAGELPYPYPARVWSVAGPYLSADRYCQRAGSGTKQKTRQLAGFLCPGAELSRPLPAVPCQGQCPWHGPACHAPS